MGQKETSWSYSSDGDQFTVLVRGEIDYSVSTEFRAFMREFIENSRNGVTLDLSALDYLDSSGLAVLIEARRLLAEKQRSLTISALTPQVEKILRLTQVSALFGL